MNLSLAIAHLFECGKQANARINHVHERAPRAVYNYEISPFEELLGRDKSETIHRRNIKILAAELFQACVRYFHQIFIFSPSDNPLKTMKNAFYFI